MESGEIYTAPGLSDTANTVSQATSYGCIVMNRSAVSPGNGPDEVRYGDETDSLGRPAGGKYNSTADSISLGIDFLKSEPVGRLLMYKRPLVEIDSRAHVDTALRRMETNNLLSLPVFDTQKKEYIGLITIFDIMVFIVSSFFDENGDPVPKDMASEIGKISVRELVGTSDYFKAGVWREHGLLVLEPGCPLFDVIGPMSRGVQRVLVRQIPTGLDEGFNEFIGEGKRVDHAVVSQSDLVRFLCEHSKLFGHTFSKTVAELHLDHPQGLRRFVTIHADRPALEAFRNMFIADADCCAIVNSTGKLISTLSAADLRGLRIKSVQALTMPVHQYIARNHFGVLPNAIGVRSDSTLLATAATSVVAGVHRVWVIDSEDRPISVVRLTDVLSALARHVEPTVVMWREE
eukprot:Opistho-2@91523